jgi:hypothetical protein
VVSDRIIASTHALQSSYPIEDSFIIAVYMRDKSAAIFMPDRHRNMSHRIRRHRTLVAFKRSFPGLLQDLYQMETQPDEETGLMVDLPIAQLEGDDN